MRKVKQGFMLAAGIAAAASLASCSGRSWTTAHNDVPARSAAVVSGPSAATQALASGRFADAAALNAAVLMETAENRQAQLGYALAQLGLGQTEQAVARLRALAAYGGTPDPDVGLALALAGEAEEGVAILERAAAKPGADARTRQNLALALALADDWRNARTLVERDAGRARATRQLTRWAVWAALAPQDRLAGFLGVAPVASDTLLAGGAPPLPEPPLLLAAKPQSSPEQATALVAQAEIAATPEAVKKVETTELAVAQPAPEVAETEPSAPAAARNQGDWVVQLAAFRHTASVESGWQSLQARYPGLLSRYTPQMTQGGQWHRLSIGAFEGREDAMDECRALRRRGIDCFARKADA